MGNSCSPGCRWWCLGWRLFMLSFIPLDVLGKIWNLIESVSEGFLTYSCIGTKSVRVQDGSPDSAFPSHKNFNVKL